MAVILYNFYIEAIKSKSQPIEGIVSIPKQYLDTTKSKTEGSVVNSPDDVVVSPKLSETEEPVVNPQNVVDMSPELSQDLLEISQNVPLVESSKSVETSRNVSLEQPVEPVVNSRDVVPFESSKPVETSTDLLPKQKSPTILPQDSPEIHQNVPLESSKDSKQQSSNSAKPKSTIGSDISNVRGKPTKEIVPMKEFSETQATWLVEQAARAEQSRSSGNSTQQSRSSDPTRIDNEGFTTVKRGRKKDEPQSGNNNFRQLHNGGSLNINSHYENKYMKYIEKINNLLLIE
jgi:hypothetical protein